MAGNAGPVQSVTSTGAIAVAVFVLATAVRLLAIALWGDAHEIGVDQSEYLALGKNLRFHGVLSYGAPHRWGDFASLDSTGPFLPTAARPPLYPLMIAALWWGDAPPFLAIRIVQAVLGGGVAVLVYLMALRVFGQRTALLAGVAMSLAPYSSYLTVLFMSETLSIFLLTLGLWLWGGKHWFLAGLALGAAALTRAALLPLIAVVALLALIFRFNRRGHLWLVLGAIVMIGPWTVRNLVTQHAFIPVASTGWGANLFLATFDAPFGEGNPFVAVGNDETFRRIVETAPTDLEAEREFTRAALARIVAAPVRWLVIRIKQHPRLFLSSGYYLRPLFPLSDAVLRASYLAVGVLFLLVSVAGMVLAAKAWREVYHLALYPVVVCLVQFPAVGEERYSTQLSPMLVIFAGYAISTLMMRYAARGGGPTARS